MAKILLGGAGGAPTENVVRSLHEGKVKECLVGIGSEPFDLMLSNTDRKYQVPYANAKNYKERLAHIIKKEKPDMAHFQNDLEVAEISRNREAIIEQGVKLYMPSKEVIENCIDKGKSAKIWQREGIRIPKTFEINNEEDLKNAFLSLGDENGNIWIRANKGAAGKGALPTNDYNFAKIWIERFKGWGSFTAAELLTSKTVTWLSIWYEGELVVAQTRKRNGWNFGDRTLSGVTGITRIGETCSDNVVNDVAMNSIRSIDSRPNGIYGVDMTYDRNGFPNPTEINISRFFTTVYFFTAAGLNMPEIYKNIALYNKFPTLEKKINPLKDGLIWVRGMDREPRLTSIEEMENEISLYE